MTSSIFMQSGFACELRKGPHFRRCETLLEHKVARCATIREDLPRSRGLFWERGNFVASAISAEKSVSKSPEDSGRYNAARSKDILGRVHRTRVLRQQISHLLPSVSSKN